MRHGYLPNSSRVQWVILIGVIVAFVLTFIPFYKAVGEIGIVLTAAPIAAGGLLKGKRGGFLTWLLCIPMISLLFYLAGIPRESMWIHNIPGSAVGLIMGIGTGRLRTLIRKLEEKSDLLVQEQGLLKSEIDCRKEAEEALQISRNELERRVSERTSELLKTNKTLESEIEERKKTETQLREAENLHRTLAGNSLTGVFMVDEDGFVFANNTFCSVSGFSWDELKSMDPVRLLVPEKRERGRALLMRRFSGEGSSDEYEIGILRKDGLVRDAQIRLTGLVFNNRAAVLGNIIDITERKRAEEKVIETKNLLQTVFDGISDPLIMLDHGMYLKMMNKAAMKYYGLSEGTEGVGRPCYNFFKGQWSPCEQCHIFPAVSKGKAASFEREGFRDPGRVEQVFIYPVKEKDCKIDGAIVSIRDITENRLLEKQLIQNEKMAALGLLTSSIIHEVNNPNNFISFNIPILRDYWQKVIPVIDQYAEGREWFGMSYGEFRQDVFNLLNNMEHGSKRISSTVNGLKKYILKKEKKDRKWVDLKQVVENSIALCQGMVKKMVKSFEVDLPENLPQLFTDPEAIEQILINLLINAAQAADKEDSWIKLRVATGKTRRERRIIEVTDNGCGMDGQTKEKIFDVFFTTKTIGKGMGLGLYVCQVLAEGLGGEITVESEQGKGSTFRLILSDVNCWSEQRRDEQVLRPNPVS